MKRTILWVDSDALLEDRGTIWPYYEELSGRFTSGRFRRNAIEIRLIGGVDNAFSELGRLGETCIGVILEVILNPQKLFQQKVDSDGWNRTGLLLIDLIRETRPRLPFIVFTYVTNEKILSDLNKRDRVVVYSKTPKREYPFLFPFESPDAVGGFFKL